MWNDHYLGFSFNTLTYQNEILLKSMLHLKKTLDYEIPHLGITFPDVQFQLASQPLKGCAGPLLSS